MLSLCLLTLSCLEIFLTNVVWTFNIFENNFGIKPKFTKYLKEDCVMDFDQHFSCICFLLIAFVGEIFLKRSGSLGPLGKN